MVYYKVGVSIVGTWNGGDNWMIDFREIPFHDDDLKELMELEIDFAFQPIYDAASLEIAAYEALMRPKGKTPLELIDEYQKKNKLYYFNMICLCFFPLIRVGTFSDFCMRASIPALFLLCLWVIEAIQQSGREKERMLYMGLLFVFLVGSVTPIGEMSRTITENYKRYINNQTIYADEVPITEILDAGNFSGNIEHNFFFEYIAK